MSPGQLRQPVLPLKEWGTEVRGVVWKEKTVTCVYHAWRAGEPEGFHWRPATSLRLFRRGHLRREENSRPHVHLGV